MISLSSLVLTLAFGGNCTMPGPSGPASLLCGPNVPAAYEESAAEHVLRMQARYAVVEQELGARDVSALTASERTERARLLGVLHDYRVRADFGHNIDFPEARMPYFVDAEGRRCAVAQLLHERGA